jgi:rSAM/selenodomain-associated transferase 1
MTAGSGRVLLTDADRDAVFGVQLLVLAKLPRPGRVKTRLSPPYTPSQAAKLAAAALRDTLEAVAATRCARRVLAFDGPPGAWLPAGFAPIHQRGDGLAQRLGNAIMDAYAQHPIPVLLVGMDTPQLDTSILEGAAESLVAGPQDAVLGPATDGGFWTIGLNRPHPDTFSNVEMSVATTCRQQHQQLTQLGFRVGTLPVFTDVDDAETAEAVAAEAPDSWFAARLAAIRRSAARQEVG